jgi:hypothetical protein
MFNLYYNPYNYNLHNYNCYNHNLYNHNHNHICMPGKINKAEVETHC